MIWRNVCANKHKESLTPKASSKKFDSFLWEKLLAIKNSTLQQKNEHSNSILSLTLSVSYTVIHNFCLLMYHT
jgi:hypothetical protein